MMTAKDFAPFVARAFTWLDERGPPDWLDRIDLPSLNMACNENCALAQITGKTYEWAAGRLRGTFDPYRLGFALKPEFEIQADAGQLFAVYNYRAADYAELTQAWREAVVRLRLLRSRPKRWLTFIPAWRALVREGQREEPCEAIECEREVVPIGLRTLPT